MSQENHEDIYCNNMLANRIIYKGLLLLLERV